MQFFVYIYIYIYVHTRMYACAYVQLCTSKNFGVSPLGLHVAWSTKSPKLRDKKQKEGERIVQQCDRSPEDWTRRRRRFKEFQPVCQRNSEREKERKREGESEAKEASQRERS